MNLPIPRLPVLGACLAVTLSHSPCHAGERWSEERANGWYAAHAWPVGCNFNPSTAINQLEMWQTETFDPQTIDRELGWAAGLGFNTVRTYLHDLAWKQDPEGFLDRVDEFLVISAKHGIRPMLVIFDGVWDPFPKPGPQRDPKPHVHNSGWVQSPSQEILKDPARHDELEPYVTALVTRFKDDRRILAWDLYNEPDNPNRNSYGEVELPDKAAAMMPLLRKVFAWARAVDPAQPLTAGVWIGNWADPDKLTPMERFMLDESDVISFHNYDDAEAFMACVTNLRRYNRPIFCTEYMARPRGSTFDPILGICKEHKVGAYNWGFVAGRSQTIYPWETWQRARDSEPEIWFHDILRADGTPFDPAEVDYIRSLTNRLRPPTP